MGIVRTGTVYDRGEYVEVQGRRTWVMRAGPRGMSGPPVVFLHGAPTSSFLYRNVVRALAEEYDCIAFDWYGYGSSEKPKRADYSLEAFREFLDAFLDRMDLDRYRLVAHDFAGPVALDHATRNPQRVTQLALLDTTLYWRDFRPPFPAVTQFVPLVRHAVRPFFGKAAFLYFFRQAFGHPERLDRATVDAYWRLLRESDGVHTLWRTWEQYPESLKIIPEIRRRLPKLSTPVLLLWGGRDPYIPLANAHRLAEDIPHAHVDVIEDAGHFLQEEAAEEVAARLITFFENAAPGP